MNPNEAKLRYIQQLADTKRELAALDKQVATATAADVDRLSLARIHLESEIKIALAKIRQVNALLSQAKIDQEANKE